MRYCAYALEADALAKETTVQEKAMRATALTSSRAAFTQAISDVFAARRKAQEAAVKEAAEKKNKEAAEKEKSDKPGTKQ
jgi:hypothetical protein